MQDIIVSIDVLQLTLSRYQSSGACINISVISKYLTRNYCMIVSWNKQKGARGDVRYKQFEGDANLTQKYYRPMITFYDISYQRYNFVMISYIMNLCVTCYTYIRTSYLLFYALCRLFDNTFYYVSGDITCIFDISQQNICLHHWLVFRECIDFQKYTAAARSLNYGQERLRAQQSCVNQQRRHTIAPCICSLHAIHISHSSTFRSN